MFFFQDHLQEVIEKWDSIDDEIWAKVIVLERNRRVAKAYARAPVITVNGSTDGFDGFRIGVAGFDNPLRDSNTSAAIQALGKKFQSIIRKDKFRPEGKDNLGSQKRLGVLVFC